MKKIIQKIWAFLKKNWRYELAGVLFIVAVLFAWKLIGGSLGYDWRLVFRPAARAALQGHNPYDTEQFMLAPWSLLFFIPLSLLPADLGMAILVVLGFCVYAWVAIKLKAKPLGVVVILLSPMVLHNLVVGNIDWLALLGFVLPPQIGLFFLALKPQIGIVLMVYWAYVAFREKRFLKTFLPFIGVFLLSLGIFGLWPLGFTTVEPRYNASFWPFSIPFGLVALVMLFRKKDERIARGISPLFSPHVMFHSWAALLYALAPDTWELVTAVAASWLLVALAGIKLA